MKLADFALMMFAILAIITIAKWQGEHVRYLDIAVLVALYQILNNQNKLDHSTTGETIAVIRRKPNE